MAVRGSRLTRALLVGVVVVVLLGSGTALTISAAQRRAAAASAGAVVTTGAATSSAAPARARSTADTQPAAGPSNNQTVQLSAAARSHPRSLQVQRLLQAYFDAINNHDYVAWSEAVTAAQTEHQDSERWLQAYASTVDSSIWLQSLSGNPLRAEIRFTSEQDPDLAPADLRADCIDWVLSYQLEEQNGQLVVGSTVPNTGSRTKCT